MLVVAKRLYLRACTEREAKGRYLSSAGGRRPTGGRGPQDRPHSRTRGGEPGRKAGPAGSPVDGGNEEGRVMKKRFQIIIPPLLCISLAALPCFSLIILKLIA